ncbi:MAG: hypothetical protein EHM56_14815 [Chloroflexi bacterium]|nr:MAG: hypothetical protein EHM56_14815 [Chloroflexota bacterium]
MKAELPQDDNEKRRLVFKLVSQLHCLDCGRAYDRDDFSLAHRWEEVWVLTSQCHHCQGRSHIVIFMHVDAAPGPGCDLTPDEAKSIEQLPVISADDVLDMHLFLSEFDGDFEELFAG